MKGLLVVLLLALGFFYYKQRERAQGLEADLAAAQEKVSQLEVQLAAQARPQVPGQSASQPAGASSPVGKPTSPSGSWMWDKHQGSGSLSPRPAGDH